MPIYPERRKLSRLPLEVTLRVKASSNPLRPILGKRAMSAPREFSFGPKRGSNQGQDIECVLVLPENLTLATEPFLVGCKGTVLRVGQERPEAWWASRWK